jgi:hypothetical protein
MTLLKQGVFVSRVAEEPAAGRNTPEQQDVLGGLSTRLEGSMPEASSSRLSRPSPARRLVQVGSIALCPVCEGIGHVQLVDGRWGSCVVCNERGLVPEVIRFRVAMAPCEGCLGRGVWWSGELCSLCGGYGRAPIMLGSESSEEQAA